MTNDVDGLNNKKYYLSVENNILFDTALIVQ